MPDLNHISLPLLSRFISMMNKMGVTPEELEQASLGGIISKQVAAGFKGSYTLVQLLRQSGQIYSSEVLNLEFEKFPLEDDGTGQEPVLEFAFSEAITGLEAEKRLKRYGYQPIGFKRSLEYLSVCITAQLEHPLVCLGSKYGDDLHIPIFTNCVEHGIKKGVRVFSQKQIFDPSHRFLVVRDVTSKPLSKKSRQELLALLLVMTGLEKSDLAERKDVLLELDETKNLPIIEFKFDREEKCSEAVAQLVQLNYRAVGLRRALEYFVTLKNRRSLKYVLFGPCFIPESVPLRQPVVRVLPRGEAFIGGTNWTTDEDFRFLVVKPSDKT